MGEHRKTRLTTLGPQEDALVDRAREIFSTHSAAIAWLLRVLNGAIMRGILRWDLNELQGLASNFSNEIRAKADLPECAGRSSLRGCGEPSPRRISAAIRRPVHRAEAVAAEALGWAVRPSADAALGFSSSWLTSFSACSRASRSIA